MLNNTLNNATNSSDFTYGNWASLDAVENVTKYVLIGLAVFTVVTNGIVLLAMVMDPLKCFRTPLTILISGVVLADFLVGLVVGPVAISEYFLWSDSTADLDDLMKLLRASEILSTVIINVSFLIIVMVTACQLLAVKSPKMFKRLITKKFAIAWVVLTWLYAIFFALLPEITGISFLVFWMIDLYAHNVLFVLVLVVLYVLMYLAFKRRTGGEWRSRESQSSVPAFNEDIEKSRQQEKQFAKGLFIMGALLAVTVVPMTITLAVLFHNKTHTGATFVEEIIAYEITHLFLVLKFGLDPLVYVLYFPKYRKGVEATLKRLFGKKEELPAARLTQENRHSWGTVSDEAKADDIPNVQVAGSELGNGEDQRAQVV